MPSVLSIDKNLAIVLENSHKSANELYRKSYFSQFVRFVSHILCMIGQELSSVLSR